MSNDRRISRTVPQAAEGLAETYSSYIRYSPDVLRDLLHQVLQSTAAETPVSIDIGSGTGELLTVLRQLSPKANFAAIDISLAMLRQIRDPRDTRTMRVVARGEAIPFNDKSFDIAFCVCAIHLMDQQLVLREMGRILRTNGLAAILVHQPEDLRREIFHRYFPAFARLESGRHNSMAQIATMAGESGLTLLKKYRRESSVSFRTPDEAIAFVSKRPFFGLRQLSDDVFAEGLRQFAESVHTSFNEGMPVVSPSAITMGLFRKT